MSMSTPLRESILDRLQAGQWRAGDRLPTERELSERFGVSRTTVRKALLELKQQGLIEQTVGSGTFVAEPVSSQLPHNSAQHTSPAELMEARLALEPAIIDLVVRNATAHALRHGAGAPVVGEFSSSRLNNALVRGDQTASFARAGAQAFHRLGFFSYSASVKPGGDAAAVAALSRELGITRSHANATAALERAKLFFCLHETFYIAVAAGPSTGRNFMERNGVLAIGADRKTS